MENTRDATQPTAGNAAASDAHSLLQREATELLQQLEGRIAANDYASARPLLPRLLYLAAPTPYVWERAALVHQQLKNHAVARAHATRAVVQGKRSVSALRTLFGVLYEQQDFRPAEKILQELLARDDLDSPTRAACHTDYSVLARRFHHAQKSVEQIVKAEQYDYRALKYFLFHRMFAYMCNQQWRQGLAFFEDRFGFEDFPIFSKQEFQQRFPRWDKLEKKDNSKDILFVVEEQGYGDFLQFARFLPLLKPKVKHLVVAVPKPLLRLIERSPCATGIKVVPTGVYPDPMTAWLPIASLPHVLADDLADKNNETKIPTTTPYLGCKDTGLLAQTPLANNMVKNTKKKIGIVWSSGPGAIDHQTRSLQLTDFLPLLALPEVDIYSLQLEQAKNAIADNGLQSVIKDLSPWITDFHSTAELMNGLDLIITVDTASLHLAAGLNRPTILLCPFEGAWRFTIGNRGIDYHLDKDGNFNHMPPMAWYPDVTIVFQDNPHHWQGAIKKLITAVKKFVAT
ncbi:MAG: glycosyltransferase family 9 protein [Hydrotalea sp.]|nr:glycosyltransferase family 9 protein [Hydrotalea sp.]